MGPFLLVLVALLAGSFGGGEENAENVAGILGESVAFQLDLPSPFETITWQRRNKKDFNGVAVLKPGDKCLSIITLKSLQGRLNVSEDCKKIEILRLKQEDSATFRAQIQTSQQEDPLNFLFHLQVFRHLLDSDLQIHCKAIGNETWRLHCSAGEWEEGITFKMAADGRKEHSGRTLDVQDGRGKEENLNISCIAKNPISTAFSVRLLRDLCEPYAPATTMAPPSQNEGEPRCEAPSGMMVARFVAGAVVALLCVALLVWHNTGTE